MNLYSLSSFTPMEVVYPLDSNVEILNSITNYFYGLNLYNTNLFNYAKDLSINYYNTFILTDKVDKEDFLTLDTPVSAAYPKTITTTLQNLALTSVGTGFWVDFLSGSVGNCDGVFSSGTITNLGPWNMYNISFIDDKQCYISKLRYVFNRVVQVQTTQYLGPVPGSNLLGFSLTPTYFNYIYNKENNTIVLYLNNYDSLLIVCQEQDKVVLKSLDISTISNLGLFNLSAVYTLSYRDADTRIGNFTSNYNAYKQTYFPTSETSFFDCYSGLENNYLVSTNVVFEDNQYKINFQPLKNQLDLNYNFTFSNNFTGLPFDNREYESIVTGTNQELGLPDLVLTYYTYNSPLLLKKGALTYFHFPVSATPFQKLNVNDSKLVELGAFAGQNPLDSDKIFKKLEPTVAKTDIDRDQTGTYLCTWLYTSSFSARPIWLDRYYNPNYMPLVNAYTSGPPFNFVQQFNQDFRTNVTSLCSQYVTYFDKVSDLTFEPDATYSYYRISEADIKRINSTLFENQINLDTLNVYDINLKLTEQDVTSIILNNNTGISSQKTSADGDFSICFNLKSDDFTKKIGNTILNNFYNDVGLQVTNNDNLNNLIIFTSGGKILTSNYEFEDPTVYNVTLDKSNPYFPDEILSVDFNTNVEGYFITSFKSLSSNPLSALSTSFIASTGVCNFYVSVLDKNFTTTNTLLLTSFIGGNFNFVSSTVDNDYYYALFNNFYTSNFASCFTNNEGYFLIKYPLSSAGSTQSISSSYVTYLNNLALPDDLYVFDTTWNFAISSGNINYYYTDYSNNSICTDIYDRTWFIERTDFGNRVKHEITGLGNLTGYNILGVTGDSELTQEENNTCYIKNLNTDNQGNIYVISLSSNTQDLTLFKLNNLRQPIYSKKIAPSLSASYLSAYTDSFTYLDIIYKNNNGIIEPHPFVIFDTYVPSSLSAVSLKEVQVFDTDGNVEFIKSIEFESQTLLSNMTYPRGIKRSVSNNSQIIANFDNEVNNINFNLFLSDTAGDKAKTILSLDVYDLTNNDIFFTYTFNSLTGVSKLYANSILVAEYDDTDIKYAKQPVSGSTYLNSISLADPILEKTQFKCNNATVQDVKIFKKVLNSYDIRNLYIRYSKINDLVWNVPSGKRNISETIQQNFKFGLPGYKTTLFDVIVSGAKDLTDIQKAAITERIREFIKGNIPINTIINDISIRGNE